MNGLDAATRAANLEGVPGELQKHASGDGEPEGVTERGGEGEGEGGHTVLRFSRQPTSHTPHARQAAATAARSPRLAHRMYLSWCVRV